jgi:hypothetical protein
MQIARSFKLVQENRRDKKFPRFLVENRLQEMWSFPLSVFEAELRDGLSEVFQKSYRLPESFAEVLVDHVANPIIEENHDSLVSVWKDVVGQEMLLIHCMSDAKERQANHEAVGAWSKGLAQQVVRDCEIGFLAMR